MMKRILITITDEQDEWLRELAFIIKSSKAEIVRSLIKREMKTNARFRDENRTATDD